MKGDEEMTSMGTRPLTHIAAACLLLGATACDRGAQSAPARKAVINAINWEADQHTIGSEGEGFRITFPGEPAVQRQRVKDARGDTHVVENHQLDTGDVVFNFTSTSLPLSPGKAAPAVLERTARGAMASTTRPRKQRIVLSDEVPGVPGKRATWVADVDGAPVQFDYRFYIAGDVLYLVGTAWRLDRPRGAYHELMSPFVRSFKLGGKRKRAS
jgi:hypothetical protein